MVVVGAEGEPMLRLGAAGVEANLASPTWHQHARWDTAATEPGVAADADADAVWDLVAPGSGVATWLEPRGATGRVRPASTAASDRQVAFEVPIVVDGQRTVVAGTTRWEGELPSAGGLSGWLTLGAVGIAAVLVAAAVARRRRLVAGD